MMNFILYSGKYYTVEFYFDDRSKSQAFDYFDKLSNEQKKKFLNLVYMIADSGMIRSKEKFRNEGDQIYAFKPKPDRFLCFFYKGKKIIITNAFEKKSDKLPLNEKTKALHYREDYILRIDKRKYYE